MATWKKVLTSLPAMTDLSNTSHSTSKFLRGDGSWATPTDTNTNTIDMGSGFKIRDDDNDDKTITENQYFKMAIQDGSSFGTNLSGTGTTSDPYLMTFTAPFEANTFRAITSSPNTSTSTSISSSWANSHTDDGELHMPDPSGASSGDFLRYDGVWTAPPDTNTPPLTTEQVQDIVGGMLVGVETRIGVTYDDTNGRINFVVDDMTANDNTQLSNEQVQDIVGGMMTGNTETRIAVTYDDTNNEFDFVVDDMNSNTEFTLTADSGTNQTIAHSNTLDIAGGTNINTVVGATDTVTVNLDSSINVTTLTCSDINVSNLTITGSSTTIETETVAINDNIMLLDNNASGVPTNNFESGIEVERGSKTNSRLIYKNFGDASDGWGMWRLDRANRSGTFTSGSYDHSDEAYLGTVSFSTADPTNAEACFYGQVHVETDTNEIWICTDPYTNSSGGGGG